MGEAAETSPASDNLCLPASGGISPSSLGLPASGGMSPSVLPASGGIPPSSSTRSAALVSEEPKECEVPLPRFCSDMMLVVDATEDEIAAFPTSSWRYCI